MVCCPACGYNTIDAGGSKLARLAMAMLPGRASRWERRQRRHHGKGKFEWTLVDVPPGWQAKVSGFSEGIPAARRVQLQAYGLRPDYWVRVLQHSPVTVIQVEHIELALEADLADGVQVKAMQKEGLERENSE
jgi:hypothetical protein